jgi:hypothetical protein
MMPCPDSAGLYQVADIDGPMVKPTGPAPCSRKTLSKLAAASTVTPVGLKTPKAKKMLWTVGAVTNSPLRKSHVSTLTLPRESIWSASPPLQSSEANVST